MLHTSKQTLYILFFMTLVCLSIYMSKNDTESIFLFIAIATIVYLFDENMIYVLGIPVVFVNMMILLKYILNDDSNMEGFEGISDEMSDDDKKQIVEWMRKNIDENNPNVMDYELYTSPINGNQDMPSLNEIIQEIVKVKTSASNKYKGVDMLVKYFNYVSKLDQLFKDAEKQEEHGKVYNDNRDEIQFAMQLKDEIDVGIISDDVIKENTEEPAADDDDVEMDDEGEDATDSSSNDVDADAEEVEE